MAWAQILIPDDEPDARARLSSERCLPLDLFVALDIPDGRRPFDLQKQPGNQNQDTGDGTASNQDTGHRKDGTALRQLYYRLDRNVYQGPCIKGSVPSLVELKGWLNI